MVVLLRTGCLTKSRINCRKGSKPIRTVLEVKLSASTPYPQSGLKHHRNNSCICFLLLTLN